MLVLFVASTAGAAKNQDEKQRDIEKLMTMTGALAIGHQITELAITNMIEALKKSRPDLPARGFDIVREEIQKVFLTGYPEFVNLMVAIYDKHYTHEEIREMLSHYETPLGKKIIATTPVMMQESLQSSREWVTSLQPLLKEGVEQRLKKEGLMATHATEGRDTLAAGQSDSVLRSSSTQPHSLLIGKWYGEYVTEQGEKRQWIDEQYPDGTYKTHFRTFAGNGSYSDQTETGYWGTCGSIYFTMFTARIENDTRVPVDTTDPGCYDAYEIIKLSYETFEYKHITNGHHYVAKKVGNNFQFPQPSQ
jgi:hypothetical protein